ncbi:MAG TPA: VWA domain-containing protein [Polyangiaceae bacterium LLY-WYZ-14_1]|nr:VWA domain-containing protein [Polyangiaceae bacterium LLY-WYZ-14_1]
MSFRDPTALWLLTLVPLFAGLAVFGFWRRRRALARFARPEALAALGVGRAATGLRTSQAALVLLGLACLALAYAGPRYGSRTRMLRKRGVDVVVAVDFSKSMLARDVPPSRIERAKAELIRFLDDLGGDRVGLVAFAGETMEFPMTDDYAAAALFLRDLGPYDMPVGGTAIGRALVSGKRLLERSRRPLAGPGAIAPAPPELVPEAAAARAEQVIILLTDGEDHEGDPVEAARQLAEAGIKVFPVGIGSARGEPIPTYSDDGVWTGYLRDEAGEVVKTALTPEAEATLSQVAELTGGTYVRAEAGGVGMGRVREAMRRMQQQERQARRVTVHEDRYALALLPGFLALLAGSLLPDSWSGRRLRRRKGARGATGDGGPERNATGARRGRGPGARAAVAVLVGLASSSAAAALAPGSAQAWELFRRPHPSVEEGNAALEAGNPDRALAHYEEAARDLPGAPALSLDRGLALLDQGEIEGALDALRVASSPEVDPELRADAAYDLGLAFFRRGQTLAEEGAADAARQAYREAVDGFRESLRARPGDRDTAWNLELALRRLSQAEAAAEEASSEDPEDPPDQAKDDESDAKDPEDDPQDQEQEASQDGQEEPPGPDGQEEGRRDPGDADDGRSDDPEEAASGEDPPEAAGEEPGEDPRDASPGDPSDAEDDAEAAGGEGGRDGGDAPENGPEGEADAGETALPRDVETVLDALREDEESLERARARGRRGRRRPPVKDW